MATDLQSADLANLPSYPKYQYVKDRLLVRASGFEPPMFTTLGRALARPRDTSNVAELSICDPGGARTHDPLVKSQVLIYHLSYEVITKP